MDWNEKVSSISEIPAIADATAAEVMTDQSLPEYVIDYGHLCVVVDGCTCGGSGIISPAHQPGCGLEMVMSLTELHGLVELHRLAGLARLAAERSVSHVDEGGPF